MRPFQSDQITAWFPGGVLLLYRLFHTPLSEGRIACPQLYPSNWLSLDDSSSFSLLSLVCNDQMNSSWWWSTFRTGTRAENWWKLSLFFSRQGNEISLFKHKCTCETNNHVSSKLEGIFFHAQIFRANPLPCRYRERLFYEVYVSVRGRCPKNKSSDAWYFFCHRPKIWKKIKNWKLQSPGVSFDIWSSQ